MQLKLTDRGPSMWFLGEPKNLIVSLTFVNPGPVEIDFDSLDEGQQNKILIGLRDGALESDAPFQQLYQTWAKERVTTPPPNQELQTTSPSPTQKEMSKLEAQVQQREQRFQERCDYLLTQSVRAIQVGLRNEDSIAFLQRMVQAELQGKRRKGLLTFLKEKIKRLTIKAHEEISKQISRDTKRQRKNLYVPEETINFNVVESEQETVILTPEDLIIAAAEEV